MTISSSTTRTVGFNIGHVVDRLSNVQSVHEKACRFLCLACLKRCTVVVDLNLDTAGVNTRAPGCKTRLVVGYYRSFQLTLLEKCLKPENDRVNLTEVG
jgi:hypothetical protein